MIFFRSSRMRWRAFIAVNCGALPPDLLESALFGHVRGSFTGATQDREGVFGAAKGGTLFLDEIGEASAAVQVQLLRALQERKYVRVGSHVEEHADVRVVAATNRELRGEVAARRFREDLFYRLHVVPLTMPPLRERLEDVPLLAAIFVERAAARHRMPAPPLHRDAIDLLLRWPWPGNVRELANVLEAALLLTDDGVLLAQHLTAFLRAPSSALEPQPSPQPSSVVVRSDAMENPVTSDALRRSGGNVTAAARVAGRNRSDFYDLMRRHGLSPSAFKDVAD
jgi:two-component system, NtrC family, response regulator GlrR